MQLFLCEGITANAFAPGACGLIQNFQRTHPELSQMSPRTRGWETLD